MIAPETFRPEWLADLRRQRADRVDDALPGVLWIVLLVGAFLMLISSYFFYVADVRFHVLLQSMLTVFVALMIFLIAALDHPFRGEVSVSSASYVTIVKKIMDPLDARAASLRAEPSAYAQRPSSP